MASYYSLLRVRLREKKKVKKLNNLPNNFEMSFYKNWAEEINSTFSSNFQRKVVSEEPPSDDVKIYLLALSEFGQEIQSDVDLYMTKSRHSKTRFR